MSFAENLTTINTAAGTPTSAAAMLAFRRKSIEGDEENEPARVLLPSPRREPLRALTRNNNSRESLFEDFLGSGKDGATTTTAAATTTTATAPLSNSKPPLVARQRSETDSLPGSNQKNTNKGRTPLKTPPKPASSPFKGGRTPNVGKILSPLPLQPRKLVQAKKKKVSIDTDEFLSNAPSLQTPSSEDFNVAGADCLEGNYDNRNGCSIDEDNSLLDLKISNPFDEGTFNENEDDLDSLGWAYTLDDFMFVRKLGAGGTADVYEVLELRSRALYALKVQPATEDAMCELDLHIPLKHENVCGVIDYFYSSVRPFQDFDPQPTDRNQEANINNYLCMILEVCDNGDLHSLIDEHMTVPEDLAAKVMRGAINSLRYLHSMDTIHCDIKPANWLIDGDFEEGEAVIKLADFGMAVSSDAREIVGGSPVYMAPEHLLAWRNLTVDFDHRTDIYSLGVVFYELLMGYLPYEVLEADKSPGHHNTETGDLDGMLAEKFSGLSTGDASKTAETIPYEYPVLDLRKLNDASSDQPFYIPPPIFVEDVSTEAQDLILRLMEPSASKRITLEEAQNHEWFRKFESS